MEWGRHEKFLKDIAENTGEIPKALARKPPPLTAVEHEFFDAYNTISQSRTHYGEGYPNPLQLSEIWAYIKIVSGFDNNQSLRLLAVVKKMDNTFLKHWFKKNSSD